MNVRLAQDADGPRIGELARASGFGVEGIDWSHVHPFWLVAEAGGEVIGAIQFILTQPIGWLEMLSLDPNLTTRGRAMTVKALVGFGTMSLKAFGAQIAMGTVPDELKDYQRILTKRGAVNVGSSQRFAMRL